MGGTVLDVLSWTFLVAGSLLVIVGGVGLLRLPDFYTRIHAAGITDTLGTWLILLGLCFQAEQALVTAKLVMLLIFMVMTSPLASHAVAKAAFLRGLDPLQGRDLVDRHVVDDIDG
jgi:multicomponent Na+:H+ antiporter subunit G